MYKNLLLLSISFTPASSALSSSTLLFNFKDLNNFFSVRCCAHGTYNNTYYTGFLMGTSDPSTNKMYFAVDNNYSLPSLSVNGGLRLNVVTYGFKTS